MAGDLPGGSPRSVSEDHGTRAAAASEYARASRSSRGRSPGSSAEPTRTACRKAASRGSSRPIRAPRGSAHWSTAQVTR